ARGARPDRRVGDRLSGSWAPVSPLGRPGAQLPRTSAREQFVGSGSARLYVRDIGAGPPVVVVHGGPDFDHEYLLPDMDRLADSFRLVYYDQRGRGRSYSGQTPAEISVASEVEDLDRV